MTGTDNALYFREVARAFFARRGAPFVLSAKDLSLVAGWDEAGIPLAVVLEGIARAFEGRRPAGPGRDRVGSLSFCEAAVIQAFERYRDRGVGGRRGPGKCSDRRGTIRKAAEEFLNVLPAEVAYLKETYLEAVAKLSAGRVRDEDLEELDARVESLLAENAAAAERDAVRRELRSEHKMLPGEALGRAAAVAVAKRLRRRHKIPYLSPFYY